MIRSMTGYGLASLESGKKVITVEIRSVNSKFLDALLRIPPVYREKELEIRAELGRSIERGKVELTISLDSQEAPAGSLINQPMVRAYYAELKSISEELKLAVPDYFNVLFKFPDVMNTTRAVLDEAEWEDVKKVLEKALAAFESFRRNEGSALEKDMLERIRLIEKGLSEVEKFEPTRIENVRKRLQTSLEEFIQSNNIDRNRFEQELIFYVEKFDISEEKVRLRSHCDYFVRTMLEENSPGKKLSFISQEIGREINTIGSKANDASMQRSVVVMKDELEKIKEQILNVL